MGKKKDTPAAPGSPYLTRNRSMVAIDEKLEESLRKACSKEDPEAARRVLSDILRSSSSLQKSFRLPCKHPLHLAAYINHKEACKLLIKRGGHLKDLHSPDDEGLFVLDRAATAGNLKICELLLDKGARPDKLPADGRSALHRAASGGFIDVIQLLLDAGAKVKWKDEGGATALHCAAFNGKVECCEFLVEEGARVDAADDAKRTALHWAAHGNYAKCCKMLMELDADGEYPDLDGRTAIHYACAANSSDALRELIAWKLDIEVKDEVKRRPLHATCEVGSIQCLELLIRKKCKISPKDEGGARPLHYAALGFKECVAALLHAGERPDVRDQDNRTAVHWAAGAGQTDICKYLLEKGTPLNALDGSWASALDFAQQNGHVPTVTFLTKARAKSGSEVLAHAATSIVVWYRYRQHRRSKAADQVDLAEKDRDAALRLAASVEAKQADRQARAATTIQAQFRGHTQRKKYLAERAAEREAKEAQIKKLRLEEEKRKASEVVAAYEEKQASTQQAAATNIQRMVRGRQARKQVAQIRADKAQAAQAVVQGKQAQRDAAVKIQAQVRGHKARKEYRRQRAAKTIQASYRGHRVRAARHKERTAAVKIQSTFRGHRVRKTTGGQRNERRDAAVKIQKLARGRAARKRVKELRETAGAELSAAVLDAAAAGKADELRKLVARVTDAATIVQPETGKGPVHLAAERGHPEAIAVLVDGGFEVNAVDADGSTPALCAARENRASALAALAEHKADLNLAPPADLTTPLHAACQKGYLDSVSELLAAGADTTRLDANEKMPVELAQIAEIRAMFYNAQLREAIKSDDVALVRDSLKAGAGFHSRDKDGVTVVHLAAQLGHERCLLLLLEAGADPLIKLEGNAASAARQRVAELRAAREAAAKEAAVKVEGKGEEGDAKEGDAKEGDAKEDDAKEGVAKEGDAKDDQAKEGDAKDDQVKEGDAKEDDAKDDQPKDDQAKDEDQAKEDQANDDQANDDQAKDEDEAKEEQSGTNKEPTRQRPPPDLTHRLLSLSPIGCAATPAITTLLLSYLLERLGRDGERDDMLALEAASVDPDMPLPGKTPALVLACTNNHRRIVTWLLEQGASLALSAETTGTTPLHAAAAGGHLEIVRRLLDGGADPTRRDAANETALEAATKANVDQRIIHPIARALLWQAAEVGDSAGAVIAIQSDINVDFKNPEGLAAMHVAAARGHVGCLQALAENGALVDILRSEDNTPMHDAARNGHAEAVRALLVAGADRTLKNVDGQTPVDLGEGNDDVYQVFTEPIEPIMLDLPIPKAPNEFIGTYADGDDATSGDFSGTDAAGNTPLHFAAFLPSPTLVQACLDNDLDPTQKNKHGCLPLHYAAIAGHAQVVELLIQHSQQHINDQAHGGHTPLLLAVANCRRRAVLELVNAAHADPNIANDCGSVPLHYAVAEGHVPLTELLLEGADAGPNTADQTGLTPLHMAAMRGNLRQAELLVAKDANIVAKSEGDLCPLHFAAAEGHDAIIALLLEKGAPVDDPYGDQGAAPLHLAASGGHAKALTVLLDAGAKINAKTVDGSTALHFAAYGGHLACVQALIVAKANLEVAREDGSRPLHVAASRDHADVVNALLDRAVKIDARNNGEETPLHAAASSPQGEGKAVAVLIDRGADKEAVDMDGFTALHTAAASDAVAAARVLLDKGADVDTVDELGNHILHTACRCAGSAMIDAIMRRGGQSGRSDKLGDKALHIAARFGNVPAGEKLLDLGAKAEWKDSEGSTAMHEAARTDNARFCEMLAARKGVELAPVNNWKETPLHLAARCGARDAVDTLIELRVPLNKSNAAGDDVLFVLMEDAKNPLVPVIKKAYSERKIKPGSNLAFDKNKAKRQTMTSEVAFYLKKKKDLEKQVIERSKRRTKAMAGSKTLGLQEKRGAGRARFSHRYERTTTSTALKTKKIKRDPPLAAPAAAPAPTTDQQQRKQAATQQRQERKAFEDKAKGQGRGRGRGAGPGTGVGRGAAAPTGPARKAGLPNVRGGGSSLGTDSRKRVAPKAPAGPKPATGPSPRRRR